MERKNNIIICFLLLILCSCEKQRLLNVPITDAKVVVNGLFSINEPCVLEISKSQSLNDTNTLENVAMADVFLYEGNRLIEKLTYSPPELGEVLGTYKSNFKQFVMARKYAITVDVDGYESVTSSDIIPNSQASILSLSWPTQADSSDTYLYYELVLKQNKPEKQYFHVFLQQRWVQYSINQGDSSLSYTPWFDKQVYPEQDPISFIPTPSEPFSLSVGNLYGIMLDNQHFINDTKSIKLVAKNFNQQLANVYLESRIIVRSVSSNYFNYYFSSSQYNRTRSVPLTEPVIIHNNISKGLGNFSGYSADTSWVIRTYY